MKNLTYSDFRRSGESPEHAFRSAKRYAAFRALEARDLVRIRTEDEQENYFSVYGEPEGYEGKNGKRVSAEQERKDMVDLLDRWGCVILITEWRKDEDSEWERADSVGMCVYKDATNPLENSYVADLMSAAVDAFNEAQEADEKETAERAYWEARDTVTA